MSTIKVVLLSKILNRKSFLEKICNFWYSILSIQKICTYKDFLRPCKSLYQNEANLLRPDLIFLKPNLWTKIKQIYYYQAWYSSTQMTPCCIGFTLKPLIYAWSSTSTRSMNCSSWALNFDIFVYEYSQWNFENKNVIYILQFVDLVDLVPQAQVSIYCRNLGTQISKFNLLDTLPRNELLCQRFGGLRLQWISYKM